MLPLSHVQIAHAVSVVKNKSDIIESHVEIEELDREDGQHYKDCNGVESIH